MPKQVVIVAATIAIITGALLMPTFIKIFGKAVESFSMIICRLFKSGIKDYM